jgi:Apea-like HEPN
VPRERAAISGQLDARFELSREIDEFLLTVRLLTAGTVDSVYEVDGYSTLIAPADPSVTHFRRRTQMPPLVHRTARLSEEHHTAFEGVTSTLKAVEVQREEMVATSFDVAVAKFQESHAGSRSERIVDLATALEAMLLGGDDDTDAVAFRLRSRAAALLATDGDPGDVVYDGVGVLYGIRSKLVHGGQIKRRARRSKSTRSRRSRQTRIAGPDSRCHTPSIECKISHAEPSSRASAWPASPTPSGP